MNVYDPHMHIKEVILVGTGGTGAQIARCLARLAYDMERARLFVPAIRFIDPDTVDEKNIGRQLFSYGDLGQNKARVLGCTVQRRTRTEYLRRRPTLRCAAPCQPRPIYATDWRSGQRACPA